MTLTANSQWLRQAQVVVGKGGNGILIDALKIEFEIKKTVQSTPNTALIKIYNLNPNNESLIKNEFDEVILNAGYKDNVRIVFRGNIKHVFKYKDKTDYVTEIEAADGDEDYRNSYLNLSLAAGTTRSHIIQQVVASFNTTKLGYVGIDDEVSLFGTVLSGNARDILNNIAHETGANWSIQDGQLTIVKTTGYLPNTAIVVNSDTGMLDAPEVNDKGIGVKCLMNPQIAVNGKIQLNNNDIKIRERKVSVLSSAAEKKAKPPVRLDPDGIYKVIQLVHRGSNRGNEWMTEMRCLALDAPIPAPTDETQGGVI